MILTSEQIAKIVQKMESFKPSNKKETIPFLLNLWDELPEPKNKQPEQISNWIIDCIFNEYFQMGRVCYELNEIDEALKYFEIAYQRGKKRAFQEFDKKYWKFYSENKK